MRFGKKVRRETQSSIIFPICSEIMANLFTSTSSHCEKVLIHLFDVFRLLSAHRRACMKSPEEISSTGPLTCRAQDFESLPKWLTVKCDRNPTSHITCEISRAIFDYLLNSDSVSLKSAYSRFFEYLHSILKKNGHRNLGHYTTVLYLLLGWE